VFSADIIQNDLRLKTFPIAVKFLKETSEFPEKTRQPSMVLKKRVTICQGVTMARNYGWTVGLTKEDLVCIPAIIAFGFRGAALKFKCVFHGSTYKKPLCRVAFI
jgi:uncharacterized protein (DUF169 family)